jgi:hypothetical protein
VDMQAAADAAAKARDRENGNEEEEPDNTDSTDDKMPKRGNIPLQRTGRPVLGDSGTCKSILEVFDTFNAYMPEHKTVTVTDDSAQATLSRLHSCPCNMDTTNIIRPLQNFNRGSGFASDMLKGDVGKTTARAAALDIAKLNGDEETVRALAYEDMEMRQHGSEEDELDAESMPTTELLRGDAANLDVGCGWLAITDSTYFVKCKNMQYSDDKTHVAAEIWDLKTKKWKPSKSVKAAYYLRDFPTFYSACEVAQQNPELTKLRPDLYPQDTPREPPSIAVEREYTPVYPTEYLSEPRDVLGEDPHVLIMCADMGEMQHVFKLIAQGKLQNVFVMVAGLHLSFKVGYAAFARANSALDLIRLVREIARISKGQVFLPQAFDYDIVKAGQLNNGMSGSLTMVLIFEWIAGKVESEEWTPEHAQEMLNAVGEGHNGDISKLFKEYLAAKSLHDNLLNVIGNYASDYIAFNMLWTARGRRF